MLQVKDSSGPDLPALAICQMQCFPNSFATKLGKAYVAKTLEWFLVQEQRFLYHVNNGEKIVGYCGGFVPRGYGDGSSSGMLQHAFKEAVIGVLSKPWLLFHAELRPLYPLIFRNIKARFIKSKPKATPQQLAAYKKRAGLVVIGVLPESRGTGVIKLLMEEFDRKAVGLGVYDTALSVKKDNLRAIGAYKKFGWDVIEEQSITFVLGKTIPH